jgi:hypothetical protein
MSETKIDLFGQPLPPYENIGHETWEAAKGLSFDGSGTGQERPYRPSNGTEGMHFMAIFCERCQKDADPENRCCIAANVMLFMVGDPLYPPQWVYSADGVPVCKAFKLNEVPQ